MSSSGKEISRINNFGQKINAYTIDESHCVGVNRFTRARIAIDDPIHANSLLLLVNNSKFKSAALLRIKFNKQGRFTRCTNLAGNLDKGLGWVDSPDGGKSVQFSRPHFLSILPSKTPSKVILTDMDNRALRIVDLRNGATTSIHYDRDRKLLSLPLDDRKTKLTCKKIGWEKTIPAVAPLGNTSCINSTPNQQTNLNYEEAKENCISQGARLCEPSELRQSMFITNYSSWTSASCASCWLGESGTHCEQPIATNSQKRSWHSGQTLEKNTSDKAISDSICVEKKISIKAMGLCCADN